MSIYLNHVTLDTGHLARTTRAAVDPLAIATVADLLARALAAGAPIPMAPAALSHMALEAYAHGRALVATVLAPAGPHLPRQPHRGAHMPLATIAVAARSSGAPRLWAEIGAPAELVRPPAPWAATRLHPPLAGWPAEAAWIGDFGRVLAWAWIDRPSADAGA